ncbi:sphingomyelin synthase-related protein 1-like [Ptychodera flava]|uniref:sphingomyelin synthase-related protein 1-like n=1 Tax=Ptychodera flava TaxID=63121 RepID=UPI00396A2E76
MTNSCNSEGRPRKEETVSLITMESEDNESTFSKDDYSVHMDGSTAASRPGFETEPWKTFASFIYFLFAVFVTTFIESIVHDRLPDPEKYPPLPDIILDNVPLSPLAGTASEVILVILGATLVIVSVLHKHRMIIIRRFLCMVGTLYLLRDVTIGVTSLPECGQGIPCTHEHEYTVQERLKLAFMTFVKLGLTSTGGRLCGAYIFSGHAMMMTNMAFFITEYTPKKLYALKVLSWVLCFSGMICVLASHGHYTVDVVLGFYITYSMFVHYHSFASSRSIRKRFKWTKMWFPMLHFLESNAYGFVPNEFEWPFPRPHRIVQLF